MYKTIFGRIISLQSSLSIWAGRTILFSLIFTIFLGGLLLSLPFACKLPITFFQALFTATSATCVTGLSIVPFHEFSWFGKTILLILIQIGGLGLMTFSFFLTWNLTGIGMAEQQVAQEIFSFDRVGRIRNFLSTVIYLTLAIELIGVVLLLPIFVKFFDFWSALFYAVFYSVSAFCNAGITPNIQGLSVVATQPLVPLILALLAIIGGLGFPVIYELIEILQFKINSIKKNLHVAAPRLSLHSKIVLSLSAGLILLGMLIMLICEWPKIIQQGYSTNTLFYAFFYSVSLRSAGFNLENLKNFSHATLFISSGLMLVGASPGSTGGGIKTTTIGIVIAGILATLRGEQQTTIFGKAISPLQLNKAFSILCMSVLALFSTISLLMLSNPNIGFFKIFFEAVSAFSTTGISMEITKLLSTFGQVVLMLAMVAGRIGSLTFIFAFRKPQIKASYRLPEERVFIG